MTEIQIGDLIENRYRVLAVLGSGGMGTLYRVADQANDDAIVALKAVSLTPSDRTKQSNLERFRREFQILTQLRHPNLVSVHNYGITARGDFYFTMEWVPGEDLGSQLGHIQPVDTIPIIVQICRALAYLHARDVIHGDLKPGNVLLHDGQVKIIDFGVALEKVGSYAQASYYTPGYTAPELKQQLPIDHRADLYSLGALWYALLMGQPPQFMPGLGVERLIRLNLIEALENHKQNLLTISTLIIKLLAASPQERYPSANAVIAALNKVTGSQYALETRETARSYALRGRFVGREAEMGTLRRLWRQTLEESSKLVLVSGESGVGKTRLLEEFAVQAELDGARVARGQCVESGGSAYHPWREVLRVLVRYVEGNNGTTIQRLGPVLTTLLPELWNRPYMADAARPAELEPRAAQQRLNDAIVQVLHVAAALRPTVVIIEDAHWADQATSELLRYLARVPGRAGLQIYVTYSQDQIGTGHPLTDLEDAQVQQVHLSNLSPGTTTNLVRSMLGLEQLPKQFVERIQQTTGGNVFFVQELIRALAEDGTVLQRTVSGWEINQAALQETRLPESISQVIWQRLERLSQETLKTLQWASVVGPVFWDGAVQLVGQISGERIHPALREAVEKELILERESSAFEGQREYLFTRPTVREASYESISQQKRRRYHDRAASWLMAQADARVAEHIGLVGDHLEAAGQTEQAVIYLRWAGEQAAQQFANAEAIAYFSRALNLTPETDRAERFALLLAREKIYDLQGKRQAQLQDLAALEAIAKSLDDDRLQARVALRQAHYAQASGDFAEAIGASRKAIHMAQAVQATDLEAQGYFYWGQTLCRQGNYEAAQAQLEQALSLAKTAKLGQVQADGLRNLGIVFYYLGDYAQARFNYERALHLHHEIGDRQGESHALNNLGIVALYEGDYGGARTYYDGALRIRREIGDLRGESEALNNLGAVFSEQGEYTAARTFFEQALRIHRQIGDQQNAGLMLVNLGLLSHHMGKDKAAQEYSRQALHIAQDLGDRSTQAYAFTFLGHALAGLGQLAEAADAYQRALDLRNEMNQPNLATEPQAGLARVALAQDDPALALGYAEQILSYLQDNTLHGTEEPFRVYLTCYRVLRANQDPRAQEVLTTAHDALQERAARIGDKALRRSFLEKVAAHREIVSEWRKLLDDDR